MEPEDQDGNTPLCVALLSNQIEASYLLIEKGSNFNRQICINPKPCTLNKPQKKVKKAKKNFSKVCPKYILPYMLDLFFYDS